MDLNDTPEQATTARRCAPGSSEHSAEAPPAARQRRGRGRHRGAPRAGRASSPRAASPASRGRRSTAARASARSSRSSSTRRSPRAGVPGILDVIGVGMLGPTIIAHGTDEQKARYLGPMLHGDEVWCQLFSEPAAGSDLAGIQTRARRQDDGSWRLNGQKVWTTNAQFASYGLLLARTDPDVPKHKGLTMFIVPMDAEGVTIRGAAPDLRRGRVQRGLLRRRAARRRRGRRPGRRRLGHRADDADVRAPDDRPRLRGPGLPRRAASRSALAGDADARRDPEVRRRLGELATELLALHSPATARSRALQRGQIPGPEAGLAKVTTVNAAIAAGDLIADVLGPDALDDGGEWAYMISFLPGLKSAGGTEEILRNTIGERVLGLPPEPRLDKGIPFSELRAKEREAAACMNLELSDEQELLREAARDALVARQDGRGRARRRSRTGRRCPTSGRLAVEAGWPGLLVTEDHGGAGLGALRRDARAAGVRAACSPACRCSATCRRRALLDRGRLRRALEAARRAASSRAAWLPARPPSDLDAGWTVERARAACARGPRRAAASTATR